MNKTRLKHVSINRLFMFSIALLILCVLNNSGTVDAQGQAEKLEILNTSVESEFPEGIRFRVELRSIYPIEEIAVRFRIGQKTIGAYDYLNLQQSEDVILADLFFRTNAAANYIPPGTTISYNFEVSDVEGHILTSPVEEFIYHDPRFDWDEISEDSVSVSFHGPVRRRATAVLEAAVETLNHMGPLLGSDMDIPIRLTMYNNWPEMQFALPPASVSKRRHLVTEGQAFTDIGQLIVLGWGDHVRGTTSHEVTHVITHRAGDSSFRKVPQWLDEGLSEYGNLQPGDTYDKALWFAIANDRLLPLSSMSVMPGKPEDIIIFYGQSRSIVNFMIDSYGTDNMKLLLFNMKNGLKVGDAILEVYGMSKLELENAWRDALNVPEILPTTLDAYIPTPISTPSVQLFTFGDLRTAGAKDEKESEPALQKTPIYAPREEPTSITKGYDKTQDAEDVGSREGFVNSENEIGAEIRGGNGCTNSLYQAGQLETSSFSFVIFLAFLMALKRRGS